MRQYDEIDRQIDARLANVTNEDIEKFWRDVNGNLIELERLGFSPPNFDGDINLTVFEQSSKPLNAWQSLPHETRVAELCKYYDTQARGDETSFFDTIA